MGGDIWALLKRRKIFAILLMFMIGSGAYFLYFTVRDLIPPAAGPLNTSRSPYGGDFLALFAAGRETWLGRVGGVYDYRIISASITRMVGVDPHYLPFVYPPVALLVLAPLAALPFLSAFWLWISGTLTFLVVVVHRIGGHVLVPALVILFPAVLKSMVVGQTGVVSAAIIGTGLILLDRRPVLAGLILGLMVFKPQMVVVVPFCLLAGGYPRAFVAMGASAVAIVALSVATFGFDPWISFLGGVGTHSNTFFPAGAELWGRMPTVLIGLAHGTGSLPLASVAQGVSTISVIVLAVLVWRRTRDWSARSLVVGAGAALASPYMFDYDLSLLILPVAFLVRNILRGVAPPFVEFILCAIWFMVPGFSILANITGYQFGALLLFGLMGYAVYLSSRPPPGEHAVSPKQGARGTPVSVAARE